MSPPANTTTTQTPPDGPPGSSAELTYLEITDLVALTVQGEARWSGKAKFPKGLRPRALVIFQFHEALVAISAICPHEHASLVEAPFVQPYVIECQLHHNRYDLRGSAITAFKVERADDKLYLVWDRALGKPVAHRFSPPAESTQAESTRAEDADRLELLEREVKLLTEAAQIRERKMLETLRQMDLMIQEVEQQKHRAEQANVRLTEITEFIHRVTDAMNEVLIVLDNQGRIKQTNRRFESLLGYAGAEVQGRMMDLLLSPRDLEALRRGAGVPAASGAHAVFLARAECEIETELVTKAGQGIAYLLRSSVLLGPSGKKEGLVVVGTDIRQIKAAQQELGIAYEKVTSLLHNMRQAVFVVAAGGEILGPVSRFAATIFSGDIIGSSVYDVLFKDFDRAGQEFAAIDTALRTTFGAEDWQWDLMGDLLPRRIVYRRREAPHDETADDHPGAPRLAILRVDYCPLFNAAQVMDRLMIIVEDVTKLELLEQEKQTSKRRGQILEELTKNRPDDLRVFFSTAYGQMREARLLIGHQGAESRTTLLRLLHTLKGNARMQGLSLISQEVHNAESAATALHDGTGSTQRLRDQLAVAQLQVSEYADVAERVLHIPNDLEREAIKGLHRAVAALDALGLPWQVPPPEVPARLRELVACTAACRDAGEAAASESVRAAAAALQQALCGLLARAGHPTAEAVFEIRASLLSLFAAAAERCTESSATRRYSMSKSGWLSLYCAVFTLTGAVLHGAPRDALARAAEQARIAADIVGQEYATALLSAVLDYLDRGRADLARCALREIWRHIALYSVLESLALLGGAERALLLRAVDRPEQDDAQLVRMVEDGRVRAVSFVSFLGALRRAGTPAGEVLALLGQLFECGAGAAARMFCSPREIEDLPAAFGAAFAHATPAVINTWLAELGADLRLFPTTGEPTLPYLKKVDVLRLIRTVREFVSGNFQLLFEPVQTLQVMSAHLQELERSVRAFRQDRGEASFSALERALAHLFDTSLGSSLYRHSGMVKDIAARLGKCAQLHIVADSSIALPREQLQPLQDALVHLLRNCLDHGLEHPEERAAAGKPGVGTIEIEAKRRAEGLRLTVRDDGRGIDPGRIRDKAAHLGLLSPEAAAALTPEQAVQLIFLPHFSTAQNVTDLSGRGIGMDIVRESLTRIGADIVVDSQVGHGTRFTITLRTQE